jgi:cysteine synthase
MAVFNVSVLEAIGNTPIVELNRHGAEGSPLLLAKLELTNLGGSMKERVTLDKTLQLVEQEWDVLF